MMSDKSKPGPIRSEESLKNNGVVFMGESNVTDINYKDKKVII